MKTRQATENDFKYGNTLYDLENNEFFIKYKYEEGIFNTNKGKVLFSSEARFYTIIEDN